MARILITGMSGTGKTTVLRELKRRGHCTLDTDYDDWTLPDGTWDLPRLQAFLALHESVAVSGTVENQGQLYSAFDHIVLLSAPLNVILQRVQTRTTNPYGQARGQQDEIRHHWETVEPLLRRGATMELDGRLPVAELAYAVEALLDP